MEAGSPSALWDHCLELECLIRSHTASTNYELQGQVPETILSGQTADISPFAEFGWYDWVKYYETPNRYPEPKEELGRWLGPAMDIGPAMTSKILRDTGYVIYSSTVRPLNDHELTDPKEIKLREVFDATIQDKLGEPVTD